MLLVVDGLDRLGKSTELQKLGKVLKPKYNPPCNEESLQCVQEDIDYTLGLHSHFMEQEVLPVLRNSSPQEIIALDRSILSIGYSLTRAFPFRRTKTYRLIQQALKQAVLIFICKYFSREVTKAGHDTRFEIYLPQKDTLKEYALLLYKNDQLWKAQKRGPKAVLGSVKFLINWYLEFSRILPDLGFETEVKFVIPPELEGKR